MITEAAHRVRSAVLAAGIFVLAVGISTAGTTQVYKCFDKHLGVLYTDEPCKDGERLDIRAGDADPTALARLQRERDALDQSAAQRITDERRAALQRSIVAQSAYVPDEAFSPYAGETAYAPYAYYAVAPYYRDSGRHATGKRSPKRFEQAHAVPNPPRAVPRR